MMAEVVAELMEGKRSIEFIVISSASTLSLSRRNTRFLLLFIVVVNAVVGRHKMEVLIAQPRAQGEDGMGPSSVGGHRSFGISPGDGAAARFFFFACGLDSSPQPPRLSLSWCTYACVCRGGRALSFVLHFFWSFGFICF